MKNNPINNKNATAGIILVAFNYFRACCFTYKLKLPRKLENSNVYQRTDSFCHFNDTAVHRMPARVTIKVFRGYLSVSYGFYTRGSGRSRGIMRPSQAARPATQFNPGYSTP